MAWRYEPAIFKGKDEEQFRRACEKVLAAAGGGITWDRPWDGKHLTLYTAHNRDVHTASSQDAGMFYRAVASALDVPWMQLRLQEHDHWDFSLMRGDEDLDDFSTCPEAWQSEDDPKAEREKHSAEWRGKPKVVAEVFGVPVERIERYMVNWQLGPDPDDPEETDYRLKGKAYPTDKHGYGEPLQMDDFAAALGAYTIDDEHSRSHWIELPPPQAFLKLEKQKKG